MSRNLRAGTAGLLAAGAVAALAPSAMANETLVSTSNADSRGSTVSVYRPDRPDRVRTLQVSGATRGDALIGLDVRPATRTLYALGRNGGTAQNYIVQLNFDVKPAGFDGTAFVSPVGSRFDIRAGVAGYDFNPTVDRIRVVTDFEQNLRINPDTGAAIVDGRLAYAPTDRNAGRDPGDAHTAYTPAPFGGMTMLFGISTNQDTLVRQNPANAGTLTTVGDLGFNVGRLGGFDIARPYRNGSRTTGGTVAYAALQGEGSTGRGSNLYRVDLASGRLTRLGAIGGATPESLAILPERVRDEDRDEDR